VLRPYREDDLAGVMATWHRAWTAAYPAIDFTARLAWWRDRLTNELLPTGEVVVAEDQFGGVAGFVTITPATGYLDQLCVAPDHQGRGLAARLMAYAKGRAPGRVELHVNASNARAIAFYRREGFVVTGEAVNPNSGLPVLAMRWTE
jgi:putative acetyltransferase